MPTQAWDMAPEILTHPPTNGPRLRTLQNRFIKPHASSAWEGYASGVRRWINQAVKASAA